MTQLAIILRGLAHRASSTLMIFMVALIAATAATMGPAYYVASRTSILQDTVASVPVSGRGFEATQAGTLVSLLSPLTSGVSAELASDLGRRTARRLFASPVESLETNVLSQELGAQMPLVWRGGVCAQLQITGRCPTAAGQVIISTSLAKTTGWRAGRRLAFTNWGALTVTGIYPPPDASRDYWFGRGSSYFSYEAGPSNALNPTASVFDAMFTPQVTFVHGPPTAQGTAVYDALLTAAHLRSRDVGTLLSGMNRLTNSAQLAGQQAIVTSGIPATLTEVRSSWNAVAVPVVLITAQLLALAWLLLFLVVTDAAEARGPDIALAKLRGHGTWRTVVFGLSEPATLLILALPAGALAGWGATAALGDALLRPGTRVGLPAVGWAAAAVATAGGLTAVVLAAQRTLRRPVVEQWRRAGRRVAERGWIIDAILVTGAAAALVDLAASGQIGSARRGALGLVVPGLLGLAVGVIASRLLPVACRAAFGRTRRRGGIGGFLALRQVARRPGGVRTTMVLGVSFALAAFAIAAWLVGRSNYRLVAETQVGASDVLTVQVPDHKDLGAIVDRADPSGRLATAVDEYTSLTSGSSGQTTFGVDPRRFARIAAWQASFAHASPRRLAAKLDPPEPPPITLAGNQMRVTLTVRALAPAGRDLVAEVAVRGATSATPVELGKLPSHGVITMTGQLAGCPCTLQDLYVSTPLDQSPPVVTGTLVFNNLQVRARGRWTTLPGVFASTPAGSSGHSGPARWRAGTRDNPPDDLMAGPTGLQWHFTTPGRQNAEIVPVDRPVPLPAIASAALLGGRTGNFAIPGLDGNQLDVRVIAAAAAVPGAPAYGFIVDRRYAELAAGGNLSQVTQQVWLASGARRVIEARLAASGVRVLSAQSAGAEAALLGRQGPGLASVLFLSDAATAALLAAGAAILGIYLSARRRRYEYAALAAAGVRGRTLRGALAAEQLMVLGFGTIVGIVTGLAAAAVVLRSVPEFVSQPAAPPLSYVPATGQLAALLGAAVGVLLVAAVAAGGTLIRGVDLDQLREAPP